MVRMFIITLILAGLIATGCIKPDINIGEQLPPSQQPQDNPAVLPEQAEPEIESTSTPPRSPADMIPRITIDELLKKITEKQDIVIVDTREEIEMQYDIEHIKGAVAAPLSVIIAGEWRPDNLDREIVLYCS